MNRFFRFFAAATMLLAAGCEKDSVQSETTISLDNNNLTFGAGGGSRGVVVTSSGSWNLTDGAAWCTPSVKSGQDGVTVTFTAVENPEATERTTAFTFRCGDRTAVLNVKQQSAELSLSVPEMKLEATGSTPEVVVTCNGQWTLSGGTEWCVPSVTSGRGGDKVAFAVVENPGSEKRTAEFIFHCGAQKATLTIEQGFAEVSLSTSELVCGGEGGAAELMVTSSGPWTLIGEADWCEPSVRSGDSGGTIRFTTVENAGTESRTAMFTVVCGPKKATVTITQPVSNQPSIIYYTSKDAVLVEPYLGDVAQVVSNTYELGEGGKIVLDRRIDRIPYRMFYRNQALLSVVIPEGVTMIIGGSFMGCTNLSSVTLPQTTTLLGGGSSYLGGGGAFSGCTSLSSIVIPAAVTEIGAEVFPGCTALKEVIFSEDSRLETIGFSAFSGCTGLTEFSFPNSLKTICGGAFAGCTGLTHLTIPNGVKIEDGWLISTDGTPNGAFQDCTGLESVVLPEDMVALGDNAFFGCTRLSSVKLPETLLDIGANAFNRCESLVEITIPASVRIIQDGVQFYQDNGTFMNCKNLKKVTIPEDSELEHLGSWAFCDCSALETISLPDGLKEIAQYAFRNCSALTSLHIPDNIETIGFMAFRGCGSLREFSGKLASADKRCLVQYGTLLAFAPGGLTQYEIPQTGDGIWRIEIYAFTDCDKLESVRIPEGVTEIGDGAFQGCTRLKVLNIPDGIKAINPYMCQGCSKLTSISLPESVTKIGGYAFEGCSDLTAISIPGVQRIESEAFAECTSLTKVELPACLISMENAFYLSKGLYKVYCKPVTPPEAGNSFTGTRGDLRIYVPSGSVGAYKSDSAWNQYSDRIEGYDF